MRVGAAQSGIRLNASCSPFDAVPPELWQRFKQAVMETGKQWGLRITFGQDDGSIAQAEQRYWEMHKSVAVAQMSARQCAVYCGDVADGASEPGYCSDACRVAGRPLHPHPSRHEVASEMAGRDHVGPTQTTDG